jgi:SAM-dependent methyltransferase
VNFEKTRDIDDAFGHVFMDRHNGRDSDCVIERDDGYIDVNNSKPYFAVYDEWPTIERRAMRYVGERVLDVGCGPGRHALYLQGEGHDVTGIDISPLAIKVAKARGLKKAFVMPLSGLRFPRNSFDTVLMLGNNFALFGNPGAAKRILKRICTVTSKHARILAETLDPYRTTNPAHLRYHALNRARGRMPGQTRIRVRYGPYRDRWMHLLFVSKNEMEGILKGTGWGITRVLDEGDPHYLAILQKTAP